jgi:hypothetical protein
MAAYLLLLPSAAAQKSAHLGMILPFTNAGVEIEGR